MVDQKIIYEIIEKCSKPHITSLPYDNRYTDKDKIETRRKEIENRIQENIDKIKKLDPNNYEENDEIYRLRYENIDYLNELNKLYGFNTKDYKNERYSRKNGQIRTANPSPVGALQQKQEDLQNQIEYTNEEKSVLSSYTISNFWGYSAWFYHQGLSNDWRFDVYNWKWETYYDTDYGREMNRKVLDEPLTFQSLNVYDFTNVTNLYDAPDMPPVIKEIGFDKSIDIFDNMIEKSPPLQENTTLYRIGDFPLDMVEGERGEWKSYTSTSFNSYVAKNGLKKYAGFNPGDDRYQIKIYAPKGTKGIVPCDNTGCQDWQSEFTLGRNQKYVVLNVNHVDKTAEVLLI